MSRNIAILLLIAFLCSLLASVVLYFSVQRLNAMEAGLAISEETINFIILSSSEEDLLSSVERVVSQVEIVSNQARNWVYLSATLSILAGLFGIVALLAGQRNFVIQRDEHQRDVEIKREQAFKEGFRHAAKLLITKSKIASNALKWLDQYSPSKQDDSNAEKIISQFINNLQRLYQISPIEKIGRTVRFSPTKHRTHERISTGEEAIVIEPGWQIGNQEIYQPIVKKK